MAKRLRCEKHSRRLHVSEPEDKGRRGAAGEEDEEEKEERKARWKKRAHLNGEEGRSRLLACSRERLKVSLIFPTITPPVLLVAVLYSGN